MKFGKQFEAEQVPEWRYEYCNYKRLKEILKQIKLQNESGVGERRLSRNTQSFHRLLSSLGSMREPASPAANATHQPERVLIRHQEGEDDEFQTHFIVDEAVEPLEREFFEKLDSELEKVNAFYNSRRKEFVERAAALDEQMNTLTSAKETLEAVKSDKSNEGANVRALQDGTLETVDEEGSVKQYKIDVPAANASEALASLLTGLTSKPLLNWNLKKVKKAEALLQDAYKEFYHGLCLLKNYSSMNEIAVFKILKKYDKITSRRFLKKYLRTVENSYSKRSDRLQKLIERVEHLFTKHFGESRREKAMEMLRPEKKVDRHRVTFTTGLFMGISLALLVALVLTIRVQGLYDAAYDKTYMSSVFPVFSMFATIVLHLYLYGLNIYLWRKTWINYTFIFELRRGTELSYRDLFAVAAGLSCLALVAMILHLQLSLGKPCCSAGVEIIPFIVIAGPFLCLFLPFNILYRSSRRFFLRTLWHCLLTPLYKVFITDFFLGDQMTSQVNAFRDFEYILCYYGGGFFRTRNSKACLKNSMFISFSYVMSALPYWCRMLQCFRRWFDEPNKMHLVNALKYFSAIVAVGFRLTYTRRKTSVLWLTISILSSCWATFIQTYWDICVDWGLLKRKSANPWLRDKLAIRYKSAYYFAIVSNVLLRFAWLQSLVNSDIKGINPRLVTLLGASLEVVRRGQWNYYRLENEHFNNVGRYRAVKAIPLPFVD